MMKRTVLTAVIVAVMLALTSAPASAIGRKKDCTAGKAETFQTNDWKFFAGHKVRVHSAVCLSAGSKKVVPHLDWARRPKLTFPCWNPFFCVGEEIKVVKAPFVANTKYWTDGRGRRHLISVTYHFSLKQSVVKLPFAQVFDFSVEYWIGGSQICSIGAACDSTKKW